MPLARSGPETIVAGKGDEHAGRIAAGRKRKAENRARIIAAAFTIFGNENGLFARIEDIAEEAGVTRATFYNHFAGMIDLREALTREVTHDFLSAVTATIATMPDARDRSAVAIRFYLHRAMADQRWGWSMLNLSANGLIFGAETFDQAGQTVREGLDAGVFRIASMELGRDILLGACLAALGTILRGQAPADYPEAVAGHILVALGVPHDEARAIVHQPLPQLAAS
ncbi:TetR/AcrR family transcriptional regulator [Alteraurantiacibacter buctensis]|uniref:TetR family transcriptional regulator n=1 Tax=Alteraurantiacibacter buctensis TaxID=1503981 RepID=A0A844YY67_9SPHN|nr:TetR/AcrR family transcriptional regulator [Alteraurantiacibacter buctensis]MXO71958.1 TetR family transcriptional regulator [Alteraurantiacibacter buctensis]